jgi:N-acetylglucosamine malate deacetylase 1
VVLAPHMDDEVLGCGGTMARQVAAGSDVTVIFLTDGRHGDHR